MKKCILFYVLSLPLSLQAQIFVDQQATGRQDGSSWSDAFHNLQAAIDSAADGDQIWVAAGIYLPTHQLEGGIPSRHFSFFINKDIQLYGGFAGFEKTLDERDWSNNTTWLSGDRGQPGLQEDNSYHVVYLEYVTSKMILDGFTISGGYADAANVLGTEARGGGIYNNGNGKTSNPTIRNCTIKNNAAVFGGGMYNMGGEGEASPSLFNCLFTNNKALQDGGALYNNGLGGQASPRIENSSFVRNSSGILGGAILNLGSSLGEASPLIASCVFEANYATNFGGAITNAGWRGTASPLILSCSFTGNHTEGGGGAITNDAEKGTASATIVNSIFSGNLARHIGGGAIFNSCKFGTSLQRIVNSTFYGNESLNGGALYNTGFEATQKLLITNSIFWSNRSPNGPVFFNDSAELNINYSLLQEGDCEAAGFNLNSIICCKGKMIYDTDPLFVDPFNNEFALQECSRAIDAGHGDVLVPPHDMDGNPRRVRKIDLGPYERQEAKLVHCGFLYQKDKKAPKKVDLPIEKRKLLLAPNPVQSFSGLTIAHRLDDLESVRILDLSGKEWFYTTDEIHNKELFRLEAGLKSGTYLVIVQTSKEEITEKLIVLK